MASRSFSAEAVTFTLKALLAPHSIHGIKGIADLALGNITFGLHQLFVHGKKTDAVVHLGTHDHHIFIVISTAAQVQGQYKYVIWCCIFAPPEYNKSVITVP